MFMSAWDIFASARTSDGPLSAPANDDAAARPGALP
jgi:hypothetical protein